MAVNNVNCGPPSTTQKELQVMLAQWNNFCAAVNAANGTGNTLAAALLTGGSHPMSTITNVPAIHPIIPDQP